jgi:hypothetical protein
VTWPIPQPGEYLTCYGALNWYKGKSGEFPETAAGRAQRILKATPPPGRKTMAEQPTIPAPVAPAESGRPGLLPRLHGQANRAHAGWYLTVGALLLC